MMSEENIQEIAPLKTSIQGSIKVPGDKSISHRSILLAAMAQGTSNLSGVLDAGDIQSSISVVEKLGAKVSLTKQSDGSLAGTIDGWGLSGPHSPKDDLDCGNSGTTARLIMGILAPWDISATITGDASLQTRPMRRITAPLMKMGAKFSPAGSETLPLTVQGTKNLRGIEYSAPMASAQLKTAVLLAGVYANGETTLIEPSPSRNHTELMLPEFGVETVAANRTASVKGSECLRAANISVPGDPSSAAFLLCAAALLPGSSLTIKQVSINPMRIGFTRTLERMGADINIEQTGAAGKELIGNISIKGTNKLRGCEIPADKIPTIIDEVPILAYVASCAQGITVFRGVRELRVKETNRLASICEGLSVMGVDAWEDGDNLFIEGRGSVNTTPNLDLDSKGDHRIAMTWAVAALTGKVPIRIHNFDSVKISYPEFLNDFYKVGK